MKKLLLMMSLCSLIAGAAWAQDDDFKRERKEETAAAKDKLEGKPAPKIEVEEWMNTKDDQPLDLKKLRGKVVVLDFWGTW